MAEVVSVTVPLLATKFYIPAVRPLQTVVPRPRLVDQLSAGLSMGRKLTLVSAPAGFGKTTLVGEWVQAMGSIPAMDDVSIAWLSLDEGDNDPSRFLTYFITALNRAGREEATIGNRALSMLQALQSQPLPTQVLLTSLINEIAAFPNRIVLVLDDYHLIDAQAIHDDLAFFLESQPPQMHLAIATREDPPVRLARLRAKNQLTELRATDLRFTSAEAAEFLNQVMNLDLSAEEVAALETRTEGWIAGLQMAALSMQGRADMTSFIQAFAGSHRFILDYLVEEVLQNQPERIRSFLLQTAILERLCGPVCDAVRFGEMEPLAGQDDGKTILEELERGNLFLVPLDDQRRWYRYHHLFADVLRARLGEDQSQPLTILHRRASEWYEQNGLRSDAIRHALASEDFGYAAGLIELAYPAMEASYQDAAWLDWAKELPDELIPSRPVLSVGYAWALLSSGMMEACESRLLDAERWLDDSSVGDQCHQMVVVDQEQFRALPSSIATARAYRALALGDIPGTIANAQRALDLLPTGNYQWSVAASSLLGLAQYASGDLKAAELSLADCMAYMQQANNIPDAIGLAFLLGDIRVTLGRLHEAVSTYEQALQLAASAGEPLPLGTADLYRGVSELYCERNDLEVAAQHLHTSKELGDEAALTDWQHRLCVAQARFKEAHGDLDVALDLLAEAERLYVLSPLPNVRPIAALKTRLWVRQGRLGEALAWARDQNLSADDDLGYLREFEHITLTRVLLAQYRSGRVEDVIHQATRLLERLLQAAEEGGRMGSVIEILVLQALAHEAQGNVAPALAILERALTTAESENYVRLFVDEGPPMARLIYEAMERGIAPDYARRLLTAFPVSESKPIFLLESQVTDLEQIESLSGRELEVLQLVAEGLTNQEIATRLFLSLHTVKVHVRHILGKLSVSNRTQAVAKGRALGLLSPHNLLGPGKHR